MKTKLKSVRQSFSLSFLLCVFLLSGCVTERSPVTGERRSYGYSWEQERQIGKEGDAQIIQEFGLYPDPELQAYVQRIGQQVLATSDLREPGTPAMYRDAPFTFRVLDSPVVNAFALPGGYVYVTRGLVTHLDNEAQLAVVLGHEIAHVAARHAAQQAAKAQVGQLGLMAGAIIGTQVLGDPNLAGQLLNVGSGAFQLLLTRYSRDAEREADKLGVRYAALKGYDAAQGAAFFNTLDRIGEREGIRIPSWQSTHPDPGEREQAVLQLARQYERPLAIKRVGQDELFRQLDGVVVGENPREGFVQGSTFYHPELRFQFPVPRGWQVQNEKDLVLMVAPNQQAMMAFQLVPARSAREAAAQLAKTQGLRVVSSRPARIGGLTAVSVVAEGQAEQGQVGLLNYFIEQNGRVYSLMGVAPAQRFDTYDNQFQQIATGFSALTDPRLLNIQPVRLTIQTAQRSAPFSSFLPTGTTPGMTPEDIAILNQVRLDEIIPAGTKLKLPR